MPKKVEIVKQEAAIQPYALQQSILTLRGEQVLLDFQLAALYGVETKALNQAVKRNLNRFPEDFMFRLTPQEAAWMRSQIVTTYSQSVDYQRNDNILKPDKRRADALPYAFTEMRAEMDNIYNAIGALSMKYQDPPKPKMNPIGYEATAARYEEEAKKKNEKK